MQISSNIHTIEAFIYGSFYTIIIQYIDQWSKQKTKKVCVN